MCVYYQLVIHFADNFLISDNDVFYVFWCRNNVLQTIYFNFCSVLWTICFCFVFISYFTSHIFVFNPILPHNIQIDFRSHEAPLWTCLSLTYSKTDKLTGVFYFHFDLKIYATQNIFGTYITLRIKCRLKPNNVMIYCRISFFFSVCLSLCVLWICLISIHLSVCINALLYDFLYVFLFIQFNCFASVEPLFSYYCIQRVREMMSKLWSNMRIKCNCSRAINVL